MYCLEKAEGMGLDIHVAALGDWVPEFTRVNNRMAGITREPTAAEISAHRGLLAINALRVENLELFVHHIAPGAGLRGAEDSGAAADAESADLRADLATIIAAARVRSASPDRLHRICQDIAAHYRAKVEPNGFKAQVVVFDREACLLYKAQLDELLGPEASAVVMDSSKGSVESWRRSSPTRSSPVRS